MNLSFQASPARFGAVFRNKPAGESKYLTYTYNQGGEQIGEDCYATGEDADRLTTLRKPFGEAMKAYCAAKLAFLTNSNLLTPHKIDVNLAGSTHPNNTDEDIARRQIDDRKILEALADVPGRSDFEKAMLAYEAAQAPYRALLKELVGKAQD
jgi:hypothetical protein